MLANKALISNVSRPIVLITGTNTIAPQALYLLTWVRLHSLGKTQSSYWVCGGGDGESDGRWVRNWSSRLGRVDSRVCPCSLREDLKYKVK